MYLYLAGALALLIFGGKKVVDHIEDTAWHRFDGLFQKYGVVYGVSWKWLKAIAMNESSLGQARSVAHGLASPSDIEGSKSSDGLSWGLMQVTIKTALTMDPSATPEKLNNPEYSVKLGAQYIMKLKGMFTPGEPRYVEWVIKSYNQGPGNTKNEIKGQISNPAWHDRVEEYWARFQRNLAKVEATP